MNRTKLKNYAPQARRDFIQAMIDRAAFYGLTAKKTEPIEVLGDSAVIAGRVFPKSVAEKRQKLEKRIKRHGFDQTMEALAYTWFNRLVAIRFMELHGYLDHGYRVLSHPEGKPTPEILEHAEHVELPGLKKETVIDLKLAGNKEGELYRTLLIAQCNALHSAMPFLFERIEDETELLLPENLLHSDSLIRKLVEEIEEEDWQEVEIIGWLYQFYISEKKDQVIGKVVASEDIPAATQLFTPNWIVKYLVQNTLGRQWLATYPESPLRQQMEYYIEPAEQTLEVQEQLKAITPTSLNPEEITLLDPACGSGHILVEAYDLFKSIYLERGYRAKDIPALILQKNLFGLEIDDRAAQLAAFALMMKARADDRRIFDSEAKPSIVAFLDSQGMDASDITQALNASAQPIGEGHVSQADIFLLLELFENAKELGSLIQIPPRLTAKLIEIEKRLDDVLTFGDLMHAPAHVVKPLLQQARLLGQQYQAVVANPPYMGGKYMPKSLKHHVAEQYDGFHSDLYSVFIVRNTMFSTQYGFLGFMSPFTWMFISSHTKLRDHIIDNETLTSLIQLEYSGFAEATVPICTFTLFNRRVAGFAGSYVRLSSFRGPDRQAEKTLEAIHTPDCTWMFHTRPDDFKKIHGSPISYWITDKVRRVFENGTPLGNIANPTGGMTTGNNDKFLRLWHEISVGNFGKGIDDRNAAKKSGAKWFPYNKGGEYRKWYGNNYFVVNWKDDGREIIESGRAYPRSKEYYFKRSITWTSTSSSYFGVRHSDHGFIFDAKGSSCFASESDHKWLLGFLTSKQVSFFLSFLNPTIEFQTGNIASLPLLPSLCCDTHFIESVSRIIDEAVAIARNDWNSAEISWDFLTLPIFQSKSTAKLQTAQEVADEECLFNFARMKELEEENNRLFIDAYDLQDELSPEVSDDQITLYRPNREEDVKRLISYAIGCIMGRYSLDEPGLIYAHSGNEGFDPAQYTTFRADDDGIIPLLESDWGIRDDATNRIVEFIGVAWDKEHLEENLAFVAESLIPSKSDQPRDTIRRYLATGFYKHHLSMYKRRPIYWLFSSGKHRAFQCLVYLHRYNEGTLARMRNEYVIPLQGMTSSRIEQLTADLAKATSTSHRKKLQNEQDSLKKQQAELLAFDEKLKHYADQRIVLDLDDGVKVNYAKFGDLLAEVKAVTGGKGEE